MASAMTGMNPLLLVPEMLLFAGGLVALLGGSFLPRTRQWVTRVVALIVLAGAAATAVVIGTKGAQWAFDGTFAIDSATTVTRVVVALATLLVVGIAADEVADSPRESETYALLLFSATGACLLGGATDLMVLVVGFLLASIPIYGLIGMAGGARSAEAAMKAYLMGALFGILLLLGVTMLYGLSGTTGYIDLAQRLAAVSAGAMVAGVVAVAAGLLFEAGGVPGHFWIPDAVEGTSATAATFLTTVPKVGALVALYRLLEALPPDRAWALLVAVLAVTGMTVGNLAAFWQDDPRRLLGWSTVSQVGYLLVAVVVVRGSDLALPALLVYLAGYAVTNVAAFAVTAALPERRDLTSYRGLSSSHPWLAGALVVALLGLVGTPPTAVFVGKLTVASAAWDGGHAWLVIVLLVNTVLSLFYYLRWLAPAFRPSAGGAADPGPWSARTAVVSAVLTVALGVGGGVLWQLVDGPMLPM
ncbi:NADH-quinone oxidoreductase subunit N [Janibacter alittae]|uniref:NADH-quinone oxidoreductase subunit N n=1 Tax=Janibacter alittae TaxID=3115209 RepID=A0ABZ2MEY1_9MICO